MQTTPRCLYDSTFAEFLGSDDNNYIFGTLCDNYHGEALTTTREAWKAEISILKQVVAGVPGNGGRIVFEYDIPRLGKRIDAVILLHGIAFCLEFKVGETHILEAENSEALQVITSIAEELKTNNFPGDMIVEGKAISIVFFHSSHLTVSSNAKQR